MAKTYNFQDVLKVLLKKGLFGKQVFDNENITGDPMTNIYNNNGVQIKVCYGYDYVEVIGLEPEDFDVLRKKYLENRRLIEHAINEGFEHSC